MQSKLLRATQLLAHLHTPPSAVLSIPCITGARHAARAAPSPMVAHQWRGDAELKRNKSITLLLCQPTAQQHYQQLTQRLLL